MLFLSIGNYKKTSLMLLEKLTRNLTAFCYKTFLRELIFQTQQFHTNLNLLYNIIKGDKYFDEKKTTTNFKKLQQSYFFHYELMNFNSQK